MALKEIIEGWNELQQQVCDSKFRFFNTTLGKMVSIPLVVGILYLSYGAMTNTGYGGQIKDKVQITYGLKK